METIGDVGCFSFCQNKTFTTGGEGGMVVTDNEDIAWEARSFRDHGYDVRKQMLIEALKDCPQILTLPLDTPERKNGYYVYPIVLNLDALRCDKKTFLDAVIAEGVYAWKEFWPQSYKEEAYINHNGFGRFKFPFRSKEYTNPQSVQYDKVFCPNCAWLEERTFVVHIGPHYRMNICILSLKRY